jgi:hypothetical protein
LGYATIGYNKLEAIASLIAGVFAGSVALVGFGIDSLVEVSTSGVAASDDPVEKGCYGNNHPRGNEKWLRDLSGRVWD